ncbi:MAG: pentapeptide repeat-containing protein [Geminicoccaceae bacterium]
MTGGPGCGKSSSAKMFARDLTWSEGYNVFVVPLQGMDVRAEIEDIVGTYVKTASRGGQCLSESPIDWLREEPKTLLLVFDGLDEVARPDGAGLEVTQQFLGKLRTWLTTVNSASRETTVMALALGRPQAAEEAAKHIALAEKAILHVVPLCRLSDELLAAGDPQDFLIDDADGLREQDHRMVFWRRYAAFDPACADDEPEALADKSYQELTIEPLLLYLLMFSGYAGKEWPKAKENRNRVYQRIFERVHQWDVKEKAGSGLKIGIEKEEDFFTLMECLGLAAWLGGGRTGTEEDFELIRDKLYVPERARDFRGVEGATLRNVAVQFFAHQGGGEQPGYAFTHKSFGEYLTARSLIKASNKWLVRYEGIPDDFARVWVQLTGHQRISDEVLDFMVAEVELECNVNDESYGSWEEARLITEALVSVASATLREGFPAHTLQGNKVPADWRGLELMQRNAEEALYTLIHAWMRVGYPYELINELDVEGGWSAGAVQVDWPALDAADFLLRRLRDRWANRGVVMNVLQAWDFSMQDLGTSDLVLFDLVSCDFSQADLMEANMNRALLIDADLIASDLSRANLKGADLTRADLRGAKLEGTNMEAADIGCAYLHGLDLTNVFGLSQEQIQSALGDTDTKLPPGMTRPDHWEQA